MLPTNKLIREAIKASGLKQYGVAEKLGYQESKFSKLLRNELPIQEQKDMVRLIMNLS